MITWLSKPMITKGRACQSASPIPTVLTTLPPLAPTMAADLRRYLAVAVGGATSGSPISLRVAAQQPTATSARDRRLTGTNRLRQPSARALAAPAHPGRVPAKSAGRMWSRHDPSLIMRLSKPMTTKDSVPALSSSIPTTLPRDAIADLRRYLAAGPRPAAARDPTQHRRCGGCGTWPGAATDRCVCRLSRSDQHISTLPEAAHPGGRPFASLSSGGPGPEGRRSRCG